MKQFTTLLYHLEKAKDDTSRQEALFHFFQSANGENRLWGLWLLLGNKPRKSLDPVLLRSWTMEVTQTPEWLFEESLAATSDLPEICALLFVDQISSGEKPLAQWLALLFSFSKMELAAKKEIILQAWQELSSKERYWFNRLLIGTFRFTISTNNIVLALAKFTSRPPHSLWYRLLEDWSPNDITFDDHFLLERAKDEQVKPFLFAEWEKGTAASARKKVSTYFSFWYWEGISIQLIKRREECFLWSEEGIWLTGKFPELMEFASLLPDGTVLVGTLLAIKEGSILPGKLIQDRAKRKKPTKKLLADCPAVFLSRDILEYKEEGQLGKSFATRRALLEGWIRLNETNGILFADHLSVNNKPALNKALNEAREHQAKGVILRQQKDKGIGVNLFLAAPPLSLYALLLYVTRDDRNPDKFSKLNFAVWKGEELVPIANCNNTLSEEENLELKSFVRENTIERFGPVISIDPSLIFKLSYSGLALSSRRKSGLELQKPILEKWEKEYGLEEVIELKDLHELQRKLNKQ